MCLLACVHNMTLIAKRIHERLDFVLLFHDKRGMMNLPGTTEALYKCREDIGKLYNHSNYFY